jgi:hypothetical protein
MLGLVMLNTSGNGYCNEAGQSSTAAASSPKVAPKIPRPMCCLIFYFIADFLPKTRLDTCTKRPNCVKAVSDYANLHTAP